MIEELAYVLARATFNFHAGPDEEWNERQDFKVPVLYYEMLARTAIEFIEDKNATKQD